MKKNELKSGMIIEYRDSRKRLVVNDNLIGDDGCLTLSEFNDDLKHESQSDLDIIKVYKYKSPYPFNVLLEDDNLDLIWERKEIKLTDKEIEVLKVLKEIGLKFLARDDDDYAYLYAYGEKPYKVSYRNRWGLTSGGCIKVNNNIFNFIKWTDEEPTNIDELLKELEK